GLGRGARGMEGGGAHAPKARGAAKHPGPGPEDPWPEPVFEEAALARDRGAIDCAGEVADEGACRPPVEHDRHAFAFHLAWIKPLDRTLAGGASDLLRGIEIAAVYGGAVVVIALHCGPGAGNGRHRYALAGIE